jgi:hypothetical protein
MAAGGAHAHGVPVAVDDHAGRVGGHGRVAVALDTVVACERHGGLEDRGRGRHRAESLATVDPPARARAGRGGRGPGEVLPVLTDGGGQHDAVADDRLQRGAEGAGAALVGRGQGVLPAPHERHDDGEVHVHADRQRGIAASQAARRDGEVVHGCHAEPAQPGGNRRGEVAGTGEGVHARQREARLAVVNRGVAAELGGEALGDLHQARAGLGLGGEFEHGGGPLGAGGREASRPPAGAQSVATSTATGTPLVTMS